MDDEVLVTGATGFIGRRVAALLDAKGRKVHGLGWRDGDLAERATLERLARRRFARVIHLAGRSYVPDSWHDPAGFERTNVEGTRNVLELCRATGASLVFVSAYVYGNAARQPIAEDVPVAPNNPYAKSKHLAEQLCRSYNAAHGVAVTVLRPFNVYGPGQDSRFLVPTLLRQASEGVAIEVQDLAPRRDWVFVDDVAAAITAAAQKPRGYSVYNIGSGVSTSVAELIALVQQAYGTALPVRTVGRPRQNEIADTVADIAKAGRELGWVPATPLEAGLCRCVEEMNKR